MGLVISVFVNCTGSEIVSTGLGDKLWSMSGVDTENAANVDTAAAKASYRHMIFLVVTCILMVFVVLAFAADTYISPHVLRNYEPTFLDMVFYLYNLLHAYIFAIVVL